MKILVVDDHPMMAEALRLALLTLERAADVVCVGDLAGALAATADDTFDLALLDLGLPDCAGHDGLVRLREERPYLPVVVVSGVSDSEAIVSALDLGAMGFIPKTSSREVMLNAVRLVASGGIFVPIEALKSRSGRGAGPAATAAPPAMDRPPAAPGAAAITPAGLGLTPRQGDVLSLVLKGLPNKLIARKLDITEGTVKAHVSAVLQALSVSTRTQALIAATRLGLHLED
ncbi:MAG TPA: response regulator transcription factor [Burkholderiales bacterium]|nr:response regulator transcription factor [Burkholderiales bacterium]